MFETLYELLCGQNNDPIYNSQVFPFVGLFTLLIAALFVVFFYVVLGRWKAVWYKLYHWIVTLIIVSIITFFLAVSQAKSATQSEQLNSYIIKFGMVNILFTIIYFLVFSLAVKRASIFAKRTPF